MVEYKVEKSNVFLSSKAGVMISLEVRFDSSMWLEVKRLKIPNCKQKPSIKTVQKRTKRWSSEHYTGNKRLNTMNSTKNHVVNLVAPKVYTVPAPLVGSALLLLLLTKWLSHERVNIGIVITAKGTYYEKCHALWHLHYIWPGFRWS